MLPCYDETLAFLLGLYTEAINAEKEGALASAVAKGKAKARVKKS